jgi:flagellar motor switch protein FliG
VQSLSSEEAEGVLEEFYQKLASHEIVLKGGVDYTRKLLYTAFGVENGRGMMDRLVKTLGNETLSFDALRKSDPQQLAKFIHSEHPQTIALILSHLNPPKRPDCSCLCQWKCAPTWRFGWPIWIRFRRKSSLKSPPSSKPS